MVQKLKDIERTAITNGITKEEINRFLDANDGHGGKADEKREELKKKKKTIDAQIQASKKKLGNDIADKQKKIEKYNHSLDSFQGDMQEKKN